MNSCVGDNTFYAQAATFFVCDTRELDPVTYADDRTVRTLKQKEQHRKIDDSIVKKLGGKGLF